MKFCLYTNGISPHQLPLSEEVAARVGGENYNYIYTEGGSDKYRAIGWYDKIAVKTIQGKYQGQNSFVDNILSSVDVLLSGIRDVTLFEKRSRNGYMTIYSSERWFKPAKGILRLLNPRYFIMAWRFVNLLRTGGNVYYFPMGMHAAQDMARLCGLFSGDIRCLFCNPRLAFARKPCGKIWQENGGDGKRYCLDKMRMWGYYVEPSRKDALPVKEANKTKPQEIKVLWVGRLLNWKRVDTIVRAVGEHVNLKRVDNSLPKITLDIYGTGPEENRLKKMAAKYGDVIKFYPPVPIDEVRRLMREHDVYVLSSNAYEGWGAVVSEALEEGMNVIGTYEAGSSATILSDENLFHAGDYKRLQALLISCYNLDCSPLKSQSIGQWNAANGAIALCEFVSEAR